MLRTKFWLDWDGFNEQANWHDDETRGGRLIVLENNTIKSCDNQPQYKGSNIDLMLDNTYKISKLVRAANCVFYT